MVIAPSTACLIPARYAGAQALKHDCDAYTMTKDCDTFAAYLRDCVEDLFFQNKVDLIVTAHMHNYQSTVGCILAHCPCSHCGL